jgi:hypothetical protein
VCVTQRVHRDKVHIDAKLVRQLLKAQLPHLADLEVQAVPAEGTAKVVLRLGGELSCGCRGSRRRCAGCLSKCVWLPRLAPRLPLADTRGPHSGGSW